MTSADRVLLDTSGLYALIDSGDQYHRAARRLYERLVADGTVLWVVSYVLVEFGALVRNRLGFPALREFMHSTGGALETLWIDQSIHEEAWTRFLARDGRGLSFVDWTVFIAASRLQARIFTFDRRFRREGANVVALR
jgi:uncharacterized protein